MRDAQNDFNSSIVSVFFSALRSVIVSIYKSDSIVGLSYSFFISSLFFFSSFCYCSYLSFCFFSSSISLIFFYTWSSLFLISASSFSSLLVYGDCL